MPLGWECLAARDERLLLWPPATPQFENRPRDSTNSLGLQYRGSADVSWATCLGMRSASPDLRLYDSVTQREAASAASPAIDRRTRRCSGSRLSALFRRPMTPTIVSADAIGTK